LPRGSPASHGTLPSTALPALASPNALLRVRGNGEASGDRHQSL